MRAVSRCFNARTIVCALAVSAPSLMLAQTPAAPLPVTPTERAQRDADKVFRMILQHADTPRRAAREDKTARPAAAPRARADARDTTRAAAPVPSPSADAPATTAAEPPGRLLAPVAVLPAPPAALPAPAAALPASAPIEPAVPADTVAAPPPVAHLSPTPVTEPAMPPRLELVSRVEPEFPWRVLRMVGSGKVLVNFDVRPDGTVGRAEVVSSPHRGLNAAAEAAVLAWRFKPTGQTLLGQVEMRFE